MSYYNWFPVNTIMEFIKTLLQHGTIREAKLLNSATKAAANPEIGVTITHPAAFHVIKDCAGVASKYIPHMVWGALDDPFKVLQGKFSKKSIQELVAKSSADVAASQLITLIMDKGHKMNLLHVPKPTAPVHFEEDVNDPYGDYGCIVEEPATQPTLGCMDDDMVEALIKLFAAT